jgi:hypothetical protein
MLMPMEVIREGFAKVVVELIEGQSFVPPLSVIGVADDGSMFGVRFVREDGEMKAQLVCQHVEIQFGLPMNVMVVDDANRVARVLFRMNGERTVTLL